MEQNGQLTIFNSQSPVSDEGEELIRQRNILIKELSKRIRTNKGRPDADKETAELLYPVADTER